MWVFVIVVLIILILAFYNDLKKPKNYPKGPGWMPIVGNFTHFRNKLKRLGFHHLVFMEFAKEHGNIVGLRLGKHLVVAVHGSKLVREVLSREEFEGRPDGFFFRFRTFGKRLGIVFTDGEIWQKQRKFSLHHLKNLGFGRKQMETQIEAEARELVEFLAKESKNGAVEMKSTLDISVLNALWAMMAGERYELDDARLLALTELIHEAFMAVDTSGGILNQMPFLRYIAPKMCGFTNIRDLINKLMHFLKETLDEHRRTFCVDSPRDLIDVFIQKMGTDPEESDTFTEEQLLSLCLDLFMAGTETTSNTMAFSILYMVKYPEVQKRVQRELDEVTGGNRLPTLQDKLKLPYTEAVLMEIQRKVNVAPLGIPHRATCDVELSEYTIPKGTMLLANLYSVHMDPTFWMDPENFRPERFLSTDGKIEIPEQHFLPFGYGKRRCLGESLAKTNYFIFFTAILHTFILEKDPNGPEIDLEGRDGFTLTPKSVCVKLKPRL